MDAPAIAGGIVVAAEAEHFPFTRRLPDKSLVGKFGFIRLAVAGVTGRAGKIRVGDGGRRGDPVAFSERPRRGR